MQSYRMSNHQQATHTAVDHLDEAAIKVTLRADNVVLGDSNLIGEVELLLEEVDNLKGDSKADAGAVIQDMGVAERIVLQGGDAQVFATDPLAHLAELELLANDGLQGLLGGVLIEAGNLHIDRQFGGLPWDAVFVEQDEARRQGLVQRRTGDAKGGGHEQLDAGGHRSGCVLYFLCKRISFPVASLVISLFALPGHAVAFLTTPRASLKRKVVTLNYICPASATRIAV